MPLPPIYVDRSIAGDHEVLRTQIGNSSIWSDWKYNGLLPLATVVLNGPEEAIWWLLSQLLRHSFCGICGNELEGLALIAQGQKSLFPHWLALHHLFCYHTYWSGDTQNGHLGFYVHPFMTQCFYCGWDCTQECAQAHRRWILPLVVLVWESFWKATLLYSRWHQRRNRNQTKVLMGRNWTSLWDAIGSTTGASPPCLVGRTGRDG